MQSLKRIEKLVILKFLAWLASRDGEISPKEVSFLEDVSRQMQIDPLPPLEKLVEREAPYKILPNLESNDSKHLLLKLLIQMAFADGVYDARERKSVMETASALSLSGAVVENIEHEMAEQLNQNLIALFQQKAAEPKSCAWKKTASVAGMSVVGGAALFITGGLAAPAIAGAIGSALLGLSGAAASSAGLAFLGGGSLAAGGAGMVGGKILIATLLGACGAGTAGWKENHRLGDLKEWEIEHIGGRSLHTCIGVSGFLQQDQSQTEIWSALNQVSPNTCNYTLVWESKAQRDLFKVLASVSQKGLIGASVVMAAKSATKKAFALVAWPLTLLSAFEIIDNPWSVAKNRAEQAGKLLGDYIAENQFGGLPVTLVGYSLGTRVIMAAIARLAERDAIGKIYNVYFLAGAVANNDSRLKDLNKIVSGSVVNVYSRRDMVLQYIYRGAEWFALPIGLDELKVDNAINIDVTETVGGHLAYVPNLKAILSEINAELGISSPTISKPENNARLNTLKIRLNQVPGMSPANRADFRHSQPYLKFKDGIQVCTWKNAIGVDHVFISDENKRCIYAGYVGWVHSSGLEVTLQTLQRDYARDLI